MLEATLKTLPDQAVLCATERGMVNRHMAAAADKAFARLRAGAEALGVMPQVRGALGICPDMPKGPDDPDVRFVAAFVLAGAAPADAAQHGLTAESVAAGRWAVFRHVGGYDTLWKTWTAIYGEWLPASGHTLREAAAYERYETAPGEVPPDQHITDIHIPIV